MTYEDIREAATRQGLVWGFDFMDGLARAVSDADLSKPDERPLGLRWLHFNLADQRSQRWLGAVRPLPPKVLDVLLSVDAAQRFILDEEAIGLVLHDIEYELHKSEPRVGVFRVALAPGMIISGRHHPLRSAELLKRRIETGARVADAAAALDLIFACLTEVFRGISNELEGAVQEIEDELLKDRPSPDARTFINIRSLMVRMHRLYGGARTMLSRLEDEGEAPAFSQEAGSRFAARLSNLDAELLAIQSQLRLLRDELDLQATQQTNRNLYFLSVLTALLMPATLVTGIFGMNTGGLPWTGDRMGSLWATGLAGLSAALVYLVLRLTGFIRR